MRSPILDRSFRNEFHQHHGANGSSQYHLIRIISIRLSIAYHLAWIHCNTRDYECHLGHRAHQSVVPSSTHSDRDCTHAHQSLIRGPIQGRSYQEHNWPRWTWRSSGSRIHQLIYFLGQNGKHWDLAPCTSWQNDSRVVMSVQKSTAVDSTSDCFLWVLASSRRQDYNLFPWAS